MKTRRNRHWIVSREMFMRSFGVGIGLLNTFRSRNKIEKDGDDSIRPLAKREAQIKWLFRCLEVYTLGKFLEGILIDP
ncbi:hypothetical protein HZH66_009556 [Vespula vulgaris]|uniref:Uncharacterized protein n=1 Tax=Vespula vulgaris TaxID=7454 RepID=A0A834JP82_VESVU|nr:hypothetical protein HZH66_009556 [Vespula vulgaris]